MLDATPLLKLYANCRLRRLTMQSPEAAQERELLALVARARDTSFGRDHGFDDISDVAGFQARVPLRHYEDFWETYWRANFPTLTDSTWPGTVPYFAVTSGTTTGATKYIPCTAGMMASNRKASFDLLSHHIHNRPESRILAGRSFMLGGSTDLVQRAPGIYSGDLSGIAVRDMPWWVRPRYFPPRSLALLEDWEEKVELLARRSLEANIRSISGTPSWLLILFDRIAALRPGIGPELVNFFPDLELLVHGGVNFMPYRKRFDALLAGGHAELREVYPASEGFLGVADLGYGDGLRLMLDSGIFMEFIPVDELETPNPTRHWIGNAECGVNYAIAVSTCAGLWSYFIGDTVEFVDLDPPRVLITGRTAYMLSAFGEHLIDAEIEEAVTAAADGIDETVTDYSVGAVFPERESELGGHLYFVEFGGGVPEAGLMARFTDELDRTLCETNEDYAAHRAGGYGMKPPEVRAVTPGTFAAWMKSHGKLGGQNKVPRVINDTDLFDGLRNFAER